MKDYAEYWGKYFERDCNALIRGMLQINQGRQRAIKSSMSSIQGTQYKILLPYIEKRSFVEDVYRDSLIDLAFFFHKHRKPFGNEKLNTLFSYLAIQTSIRRVLARICSMLIMHHENINHMLPDFYQQSYLLFIEFTRRYEDIKGDEDPRDYLMYLERFMFKRLLSWYHLEVKDKKRVRERGKTVYRRLRLDGFYNSDSNRRKKTRVREEVVLLKGKQDNIYNHLYVQELLEYVRKKNPNHALCLELYYLCDLREKDIATLLNIPEGTVKAYKRRGIKSIQKELKNIS
jgi:hypothetical protein